jgi:hypothetical protein
MVVPTAWSVSVSKCLYGIGDAITKYEIERQYWRHVQCNLTTPPAWLAQFVPPYVAIASNKVSQALNDGGVPEN